MHEKTSEAEEEEEAGLRGNSESTLVLMYCRRPPSGLS